MEFKSSIESIFEGRAFLRPLFYSYPGGIRFELSEGGSAIEQFMCAMRKASTICSDIFPDDEPVAVCMRFIAPESRFGCRQLLTELHAAAITISPQREIWLEPVDVCDRFDEDIEEWRVNAAFEISARRVENLLWCALATDFSSIRPNPRCLIYLFNFNRRIMVFPYDDRGMDVAGPNRELLAALYAKHSAYLLDYDREQMDKTFCVT